MTRTYLVCCAQDLWTSSGCNTCPTLVITRLQKSLSNLSECLASGTGNTTELCNRCRPALSNVTSEYTSAGDRCRDTVDIIDAYRRGLELWSKHNCPTPTPGKSPVIILLTLVLAWVFLFYGASRIFTRMPARFFFGNVAKSSGPERGLEDDLGNVSQFFELVGPGTRPSAREYIESPPALPTLADKLAARHAQSRKGSPWTRRRGAQARTSDG